MWPDRIHIARRSKSQQDNLQKHGHQEALSDIFSNGNRTSAYNVSGSDPCEFRDLSAYQCNNGNPGIASYGDNIYKEVAKPLFLLYLDDATIMYYAEYKNTAACISDRRNVIGM